MLGVGDELAVDAVGDASFQRPECFLVGLAFVSTLASGQRGGMHDRHGGRDPTELVEASQSVSNRPTGACYQSCSAKTY